jgi:hypothetical protein
MALEKIAEINNPTLKTGVSAKNGKQWTLMQVTTDKGNLTTVFAPAAIGDTLELTWDAQYGSWKAQKVTAQQSGQMDALRKIYEINAAIYKAITGNDYGVPVIQTAPAPKPAPKPPVKAVEPPPSDEDNPHIGDSDIEPDNWDNMEQPVNLSDIPF